MRRLTTRFRRRRPAVLPSGTLTFVLTDVEGSTRLWEAVPDGMELAIPRHIEIIQHSVARNGGTLVRERGEGDSTFSVFTEATSAVAAAVDAQRALNGEAWPQDVDIRVRFALHTGEGRYAEGEYTAPAINRCARIRALGSGGQTLLSERTADLVRDALPDGSTLTDLGTHRLRDLTRPERIAQLDHPDLPDAFPALRSLDTKPHNLPVQLTSFIGRDAELNRVRKLLNTTRMLTLLGAGGLGKTRLALQVAADVVDEYDDGVWFVDLASLDDAGLVARTVALTLGLRDEPGRTTDETLVEHLSDKRSLLIVDNCEHVERSAAELATTILRGCPEVSIVATSRSRLGVAGVSDFVVPPLEVPTGKSHSSEELAGYESLRLFTERAALRNPDFALSHDNARHVLEICRRLDGIPLAIELAAAQTNVLSVAEIARRLEDRFRLLTGGPDDDPRHATLRAALDWSFQLLGAAERLLLGRLSVFAGGFSLDAVESVCSGDGLAEDVVLDVLRELVDSSLVLSVEAPDETRFTMLETVREYAVEQRRGSNDEHPTEMRHLAWFGDLAAQAARNTGADEAAVLNQLEREHDNFRAALARSLDIEADDGARIAATLQPFWDARGHWVEGRRWLEEHARHAQKGSAAWAGAETAIGVLATRQGDLATARAHLEAALETWRRLDDKRGMAHALLAHGSVLALQGELEAALAAREEARALAEEVGDEAILQHALNDLGVAAARSGEYVRAGELFEQIVAAGRRHGSRRALVRPLFNLGICRLSLGDTDGAEVALDEVRATARDLGDRKLEAASLGALSDIATDALDLERAEALVERGAAIQRELDDTLGLASSLVRLGDLRRHAGDLEHAQEFLDESVGLWRATGQVDGIAGALSIVGRVERAAGRLDAASVHLSEALSIAMNIDRKRIVAVCLEGIAGVVLDRGDADVAATLVGSAQALRDEMGVDVPPTDRDAYDRDLSAITAALGDRAEAVLDRGRHLPVAEAVALALSDQESR